MRYERTTIPAVSRLSGADWQTLPNQFDGLDFSVYPRRRCNQCDLIALEFDTADQVPIYIVLNRRDFDVMGHFVTAKVYRPA